ncbi:MAG: hypothetical protein GF417_11050, partial [Candidatus Latescibacteria bacterium]|nr:hypothetical protein [bacterium]MBD3424963.1 hypothetical protein [Candidatus Latescibacterota bacterium]
MILKMRMVALALIPILFCLPAMAQEQDSPWSISKREISSTIEFLSDDLLEGRAPGTRGGVLAENYIRSILQILDIEPYRGSYFQEFTLRGYTAEEISMQLGEEKADFKKHLMGNYVGSEREFLLEEELVFAGFGIIA